MGYYNISLTDAAKKVRTITTPFGKYECNHLPMGVCIGPDIFQEKMSSLMDDLEFFRVYLEDFLVVTSGSFEDHLAKVEEVVKRLHSGGLKCEIDNWKFELQKVEYLGYIITREGIKPDPKKILPWLMAEARWDIGNAYGID